MSDDIHEDARRTAFVKVTHEWYREFIKRVSREERDGGRFCLSRPLLNSQTAYDEN